MEQIVKGQIVKGEYVFTPCKNAFNNKTSYWISKNGYAFALYCFTPLDSEDLREHLSDKSLDEYIRYFQKKFEG